MDSHLKTGTNLGRYEIRSKIGAGGMGVVYRAEDTQLRRSVALKILPPGVAVDSVRMWRFHQEAQAAAALNHPNIAHIYEVSEHNGTHFIAMEFVDGYTLGELIHSGQTDLSKLLRYLQHTAEGLAKAHAAGIVHRDLKPDNIMITRDGHTKILDFGLAKLVEPLEASAADDAATVILRQHSTPGTVLGTVGYMSPEQARGETAKLDSRSDIFSFGCILFEAVTGQKAFQGADAIDTLNKIIREPAPPISDFRSDLPNHLQRIVRRCLAKDVEDRYQTIKDVAIELKELRKELGATAGIDTTVPPSTRGSEIRTSTAPITASSSAEYIVTGIKKHKVIFALILIAGLVAGIGLYLHFRSTSVTIDSIAVLPFQNRSTEPDTEYLSDGLTESLIYRLSQLPHLKVSPTSSVFHYKGQEIDPIKVGKELGVNAVLSGRIVEHGDNLTISAELVDVRDNKLLWGEQYERKVSELLVIQREIAREIVDVLKLKVSGKEPGLAKHYTESSEAYQLYLKGRFYWNQRSEEGLQKALAYFQQAIERDPNFALAYSGLADTLNLMGAVEAGGDMRPSDVLPKARAAALKAIELDPTLAEPHVSLGHTKAFGDRDLAGAESEFKKAIELNRNYSVAHHWYAIYLTTVGRQDQALSEIRRAMELDTLSLSINIWFGRILGAAGHSVEGLEQLRKTAELFPSSTQAHNRLGIAYEEQGMLEQALSEFEQVTKLPGGTRLGLSGRAHVYAVLGKREEAEKDLNTLLQSSKEHYVTPLSIALIYVALGNKDKAFQWLDEAEKVHDLNTYRIKQDFRSEPIRSDPRFANLIKRLGLS
jgi:serine/threonine protein kinase/tetratricopeptide (TPR) repeat protein